MYSLLVTGAAKEQSEGTFVVDRGRFLEYTEEGIATQLRTLSTEAQASIESWPCILMQEGRGEEPAYLVAIEGLAVGRDGVTLSVSQVLRGFAISNDALWKMRSVLDIGDFEFSRNHWAIKNRDLLSALLDAGHLTDTSAVSRFELKPLPAPQRADLIRARDAISAWGHTAIDDLLLEAGVNGLVASRALGGRRERANAIVQFVLDHPSETTAENSLFSAFLVRRALTPGSEVTEHVDLRTAIAPGAQPLAGPIEAPKVVSSRSPNRVFVVHGQNETVRTQVVRFLETVGLEGIVLHEQPNMGRHLLTKLIEEAELVTFAIVLMTDDDVGSLKGAPTLAPRARQNVILELGYFLSHLGQPRVCALITPGLETPSDFDGIVYIRMDTDGKWKAELTRELRAAGMPLAI